LFGEQALHALGKERLAGENEYVSGIHQLDRFGELDFTIILQIASPSP
jgi:hypothetical protein